MLAHHNTTACCGSQTLTLPEWNVELTWTSVVLIQVHPVPTGFHVSRTNLPDCPAPWLCNNILLFPFSSLKVGSCFLRLHLWAETPTDSEVGSWSPPTLSYCVKTHLPLFRRISHVLNRTLTASSSQGLRWLWPSSLLFLLLRLLLSTEDAEPADCLYSISRKRKF